VPHELLVGLAGDGVPGGVYPGPHAASPSAASMTMTVLCTRMDMTKNLPPSRRFAPKEGAARDRLAGIATGVPCPRSRGMAWRSRGPRGSSVWKAGSWLGRGQRRMRPGRACPSC
jgi:hypothetical protein